MQQHSENKAAKNTRNTQKRFTISREIANRKMSNSNIFSDDSKSRMVSSRHSVSSIKSKQNLNLQNLSPASSSFSSDLDSKDDESNHSLQLRHNDFEKIAQAHTSFQDLQDKLMIANGSFEQDFLNPLDMSDGIEHSILPIHFIAFEQRWGTKTERQRQQQCGGDEMLLSQASEGRSSHQSLNRSMRTKSIRSKKDIFQSKLHNSQKGGKQKMELSDDDDEEEEATENDKANRNEDPHIIKKYKKLAERNPLQDPYYVKLIDLHGFQRLNYELNAYSDDKQFLKLRKKIVFYSLAIPIICNIIVKSVLFKIIMSFLILFNVTLYIYSQTLQDTISTKNMEKGIMVCFMVEICIRIIASGVIIPKSAFFKNPQDIFDFILVVVYALNLTEPDIFIVDISPLRVITLLFYLGDIFQGLGVMLKALKSSIRFLLEALMIVGLFSIYFASTGVFLFQGLFNYRCQFEDGKEVDGWIQCNQNSCDEGMQCLYSSYTPKMPTSFNNVIYSYGQVLRTITMDDWSWVMFFTIRIYHPWTWIYYLLIIFVCGFFGFNLVIAVLKTHYAEAAEEHAHQEEQEEINKKLKENQVLPERDLINVFDVAFLRYIGFFQVIQRYRQAIKNSHRQIKLEDQFHEKSNENTSKTRILSAKQSKSEHEQQSARYKSFIRKIQSITLKNILLPKFYVLSERQRQISIKKYTEDEIEIQILERLKSYQFSQLYSCVNDQIQQEFISEQDVFPQLNLPDCEKKQLEKEVVQMRQAKLKIIYPDLNQKKKVKTVFKNMRQISKFPIRKPGRLILIQTEENNVDESDTSFLPKLQIQRSRKYSLKASTPDNKIPFVLKKQDQIYLHIQGYYLNFEGLQMKINQKLENENDKKKRKKAEKHNSNEFNYLQIRKNDVQSNEITKKVWSGSDILNLNQVRFQVFQSILKKLNVIDTEIWMVGINGKMQTLRKYTYWIVKTQFCQLFFDLIILINFTFLALQGIADSDIISNEEDVSTIFLCLELSLRLCSFSLKEIAQSPDYVLQTCIVILNFIELTMSSLMTGFNEQNLRLIRGTKCLLFYRVLKYNKMAIAIGHIAQKTFKQYIYLTFLMFLVIFIYALIGMEMYAGVFDQSDTLGQLHSYDNVLKAFMTIFNIMTNDDWYGVYVMGSDINYYFAVIYSYSMVIVLNYITYGLVLAILLDGFGTIDKEMQEQEDEEEEPDNNKQVENDAESQKTLDQMEEIQIHQKHLASETAISDNCKKNGKPNLIANLMKSIKQVHKTILDMNPNLYDGIYCQQSLYLFSKENAFRVICCRLVTSSFFTYLMDCVLYFSIIAFILKTYHDFEIDSSFYPDVLLFISNSLFLFELVIGSIAKGMWMNKGCFITYTWQIVDLIYIISFFIDFQSNYDSIPIIKFFLYFGYFRPMKLMYRISWLDTLRLALGQSLFDIWNVLITMLSVWIIFGVYGIILYEQQFGFCDDKMNFEVNKIECLNQNGTWINYKHNFDNITIAVPTLFVVSTFDGWGEILQVAENSQNFKDGPMAFNSYLHTYVFFIIFCFIGSMFFLSLFTGVLFSNLKKNQKKIEMTDSTKSQLEFMKITNIIIRDHPLYSSPPTSKIRRMSANITNSLTIQKAMYCLLLIDLIVLLLFYTEMSDDYFRILNNIHNILTYFYILWNVLLFLAFGINRYFDNYWRRFYFFLITIAIIDIIADFEFDWALIYFRSAPSDVGYQLLRLFLALRCLRIILIFQGLINLQRLMRVMVFAFPFLGKIFTILLITMIIFALIGCQLYGSLEGGQVMDNQINFQNVAQALLALFKSASGDDWRTIMTDTMYYNPNCVEDSIYCGGLLNQIYFFLFMLLSNYVLLNLFVLGLVEQFEQFFQLQNSMIQTYVENVDKIKTIWCKYSSDTQGRAMHYKFLCRFLLDIGKPLGGGYDENLWDVGKKASSFKLQCNHFGYIQYNQLMYELFRVCYHQEVFKEGTPSSIKRIKQFNKEMQLRLMYYRRNKFIQRSHVGPVINLRANFNILHDYLTVLIMYKAWEAYTKKLIRKLLINQKQFTEQDCEDPDSSEEQHKIQNFIEQDSKEFLNESVVQQTVTNDNQKQEIKHQITHSSVQDNQEQIPVYKWQNDKYSMQNVFENAIISPSLSDRKRFTDPKK